MSGQLHKYSVAIVAQDGTVELSGTVADPTTTLYDTSGTIIARNDNWDTPVEVDPLYPPATASALSAAMASAGASVLEAGVKDSAMLLILDPGLYTVHVGSSDGSSGVAMVEIFEVP